MSAVPTANTSAEVAVRRALHRLGLRFRLNRRDLPGRPDIVLPKHRTAIFVHGCFWHSHGCAKGRPPKSRLDYWGPKLARNTERDAEALAALGSLGWRTAVIWQCELKGPEALEERLRTIFGLENFSIDSPEKKGY